MEENDEIDNFIILENKVKEETKSKSQPSMIERINQVKELNNQYEQKMVNSKKYEKLIEELKNESSYDQSKISVSSSQNFQKSNTSSTPYIEV